MGVTRRIARVLSVADWRRWGGQAFWATTDQVLYGCAGFLLHILLARWFTEECFGVFNVAFASFVLLLAFYNGLIVEPMLVFGSGDYRSRFADYIGILFLIHLILAAIASLALFVVSLVFANSGDGALRGAFSGAAGATPFILFGWLLRRACYVREQPRLAATGGAIYTLLVFAALVLLRRASGLTVGSTFGILGAASVVSGAWLAWRLGVSWPALRDTALVRNVLRDHWRYGRWAVAARVPMRVPGSVIVFALPIWGGLAATGAYKALSVLTVPISQIIAALSAVMIPKLVRLRGSPEFARLVMLVLIVFVVCSGAYGLLLAMFSEAIVRFAFQGRYDSYAYLLWFFGGYSLFASAAEVFNVVLQSIQRTDWLFRAHTISGTVTIAATLALIITMGVHGAALGFFFSGVTASASTGFYYLRYQLGLARRDETEPRTSIPPLDDHSIQAAVVSN